MSKSHEVRKEEVRGQGYAGRPTIADAPYYMYARPKLKRETGNITVMTAAEAKKSLSRRMSLG